MCGHQRTIPRHLFWLSSLWTQALNSGQAWWHRPLPIKPSFNAGSLVNLKPTHSFKLTARGSRDLPVSTSPGPGVLWGRVGE